MTDTIGGPRYGYAPTAAFAATRASADLRRARAASAVETSSSGTPSSRGKQFLHRLATMLTGQSSN